MSLMRFLGACALLAFLSAGTGASAEGCWLSLYDDSGAVSGEWSGSCKGDKAYGDGVAKFADGGSYRGDAEDGRAHGQGVVVDARAIATRGGSPTAGVMALVPRRVRKVGA